MYRALLICNSEYQRGPEKPTHLSRLVGPATDGRVLAAALRDPATGMFGAGAVDTEHDLTTVGMTARIKRFLAAAGPDDILLLYFSGHGLIHRRELNLCGVDTDRAMLPMTALPNGYLNESIAASVARAVIIILDCCAGGSFKGDGILEQPLGTGRFIFSATPARVPAPDADAAGEPSPFTRVLADGLTRLATDADGDGLVDLEDLYRHLYAMLWDQTKPKRIFDGHGAIGIARRVPRRPVEPVPAAVTPTGNEPARGRAEQYVGATSATGAHDPGLVRAFQGLIKAGHPAAAWTRLATHDFLVRAGLLRGDRLTVAGVLLFGESPQATVPTAVVQCRVYQGSTKASPRTSQTLRGTVPEQIVRARDFVAEHSALGEAPTEDGSFAQTRYAFPMIAVREVIANAVVHRDYEHGDAVVHVRLFPDRLEVLSPGTWYGAEPPAEGEVAMADLASESRRRNFQLADLLSWISLFEGEGSGVPTAVADCDRSDARRPTVVQEDGLVRVTLYPKGSAREPERPDHRGGSATARLPLAAAVSAGGLVSLRSRPRDPAPFVGREAELAKLAAALAEPEAPPFVVNGPAGVGKSALAARYVALAGDRYRLVQWITATSPEGVERALAVLAHRIHPATAGHPDVVAAAWCREWLAGHDGWLIALDDVAAARHVLDLVTATDRGRFLITSRGDGGWPPHFGTLRLDGFTPGDAAEFLASFQMAEPLLDGATELLTELDHHPLALRLAAEYVHQNQVPAAEYVRRLRATPSTARRAGGSETTLHRVSRAALETVFAPGAEPAAARLVGLMARLAPDAVPVRLFHGIEDLTAAEVDAALARLAGCALVTRTGDTVAMPRFVHLVAREGTGRDGPAASGPDRAAAIGLLARAVPEPGSPDERMRWRELIPHIEAVLEPGSRCDQEAETTLFLRAARFLGDEGFAARAIQILERVLPDQVRLLGPAHERVLDTRRLQAALHVSAGDLRGGLRLFRTVLADTVRALGEEHPTALAVQQDHAFALEAADQPDKAVDVREGILAACERALGPDDPLTVEALAGLARSYDAAGRTGDAAALHRRAHAGAARILGREHPRTLAALTELALSSEGDGSTEHVLAYHQEVVDGRERTLGPEHPDTLAARAHLAGAHQRLGHPDRAVELLEPLAVDARRILGSNDPDALTARTGLGLAYIAARQPRRALPEFEHVLTESERLLGVRHPDTLAARSDLAFAYQEAGALRQAVELYEQTFAEARTTLGADHPGVLALRHRLALAHHLANQPGKAAELLARTLDDAVRVLGPEHPATVRIRRNQDVARSGRPARVTEPPRRPGRSAPAVPDLIPDLIPDTFAADPVPASRALGPAEIKRVQHLVTGAAQAFGPGEWGGRQLTERLRRGPAAAFLEALADFEANPGDPDYQSALRVQVRKRVDRCQLGGEDPSLADDLKAILRRYDTPPPGRSAGPVVGSGAGLATGAETGGGRGGLGFAFGPYEGQA